MVSRTLAVAVSPGEVWAAAAGDGELVGLRVAREASADAVGTVYLGRIVALRPELPAALVDIGLERPGFLDARDADRRRRLEGMTEGAAVLVEVTKAARADKAAGLRALPRNDPRREAFAAAAREAKPPAQLDRAPTAIVRAARALLDPAPDRILVDDRAALAELRRLLAGGHLDLMPRLAFHSAPPSLFEALGIAEAIDAALQPRVALPGNGALLIEGTHAATMVDVDGGGQNALAANLAAARVLARQIALRNIAGPIVVDFAGMKRREDRDKVAERLNVALAEAGIEADALGWTRLGHFELVRARREPALRELLFEAAPEGGERKTALTLGLETLRRVAREASAQPGRPFALALHPEIAAALEEGAGGVARRSLEARLGRKLAIEADPRRPRDAVDIRAG